MELTLTRPPDSAQVVVACEGAPSHTFDLTRLIPARGVTGRPPQPLEDPIKYGEAVYAALFPPNSPAQRALEAQPERILLVLEDVELHTIPWEYACSPRGFLVLDFHFVRGLPPGQRIAAPTLMGSLHVVAVPSNPLEQDIPPLDIDGEWERLKEVIGAVPAALRLERARPPTLEKLRDLLAGQTNRVAHFMGHGGQHEGQAVLLFEKENGAVDFVTAQEFVRRVRKTVFLVTLNACVSATPGPTEFSNLAAALAAQGAPYALGMRFSIVDDDARAFSRTLYSELARGSSVEEAVMQARQTLDKNERAWAVGVPVLYTSLSAPAPGFARAEGAPRIDEHQPLLELSALPRAMGAFQGRVAELKAIGEQLTGDVRPRLLTLHSGGGQGKTALAREAAERFAHAWPGGVWAISLENLPDQAAFVVRLAEFLRLEAEPAKLEAQVLARLHARRTLLVLDNAETLVEAVRAGDEAARELANFAREHLPPTATLLVTSRVHLDWPGEAALELGGLNPAEGAELFKQSAPRRAEAIDQELAEELSRAVSGHPLSLRLLGGAFNETAERLAEFVKQAEERLLKAEDIYKGEDHRHRTLYASLETSVRYLPDELRQLLSGLWIFHAPFLPDIAVAIFDPTEYPEGQRSPVYDQLHALWGRGLLTVDLRRLRDGDVLLYHLLPTVRPFAERYLPQAHDREELLARFGAAYAGWARQIYHNLDQSATARLIASLCMDDMIRGLGFVSQESERKIYQLLLGQLLDWHGEYHKALLLIEDVLEYSQGQAPELHVASLGAIAQIYQTTHPGRAIELLEQALRLVTSSGDRRQEGGVLNNLALAYKTLGQEFRAIELYNQALDLARMEGNQVDEANILNNIAGANLNVGRLQTAFDAFKQALAIIETTKNHLVKANILNGLGRVYTALQQPQLALPLHEDALLIMREINNPNGELATIEALANAHLTLKQPENAAQLYEQAIAVAEEHGSSFIEAVLTIELADVKAYTGDIDRAFRLYEQAILLCGQIGDKVREAQALGRMAALYVAQGQRLQAIETYQQAVSLLEETEARGQGIPFLLRMGELYEDIGQPQRAIELYRKILPAQEDLAEDYPETRTLDLVADLYQESGDMHRALRFYERVLNLYKKANNYSGIVNTLNKIASARQRAGQTKLAIDAIEHSFNLARDNGDKVGQATALNNLGEMYRAMDDTQEALQCFRQALSIWDTTDDDHGRSASLNNIGLVYLALGEPLKSLEFLNLALDLRRKSNDRSGEAISLNNIARVHKRLGEIAGAIELYDESLAIRREVGDVRGEAITLNNLAKAYEAIGVFNSALEYYYFALSASRNVRDVATEADILVNIANLLSEVNRKNEARRYLEQAIELFARTGLRATASGLVSSNITQLYDELAKNLATPTTVFLKDYHREAIVTNSIAALTMGKDRLNAWRRLMTVALQQTRVPDWKSEAELFVALLALLDGQTPTLPAGHPYAGVLAQIRADIKQGGLQELPVLEEVAQAVQAFLNAEDWAATRQVVDAQQAMLFSPEAAELLQALAAQAQSEGNQRAAEMFQLHLAVLRECQANGVGPAFEKLAQAQRAQQNPADPAAGLPPDFVGKCAAALTGPPPLRATTFDWLRELAAALPAWGPLIRAVQNALPAWGTSLNELGGDLTGEQAAIWKEIVEKVLH